MFNIVDDKTILYLYLFTSYEILCVDNGERHSN